MDGRVARLPVDGAEDAESYWSKREFPLKTDVLILNSAVPHPTDAADRPRQVARRFFLTIPGKPAHNTAVRQSYHTIIKPESNGWFVGWVEEIPGTITTGKTLDECRRNLKDALQLMVETHRDEARVALDPSCIQEAIEIEVAEYRDASPPA